MLTFYKAGIKPKHWFVQIAANSLTRYIINTKMPGYITNIIGMMTLINGVGPNNVALVAGANSDNYYINLKSIGGDNILDNIRYSELLWDPFSTISKDAFLQMNIKAKNVDLVNSFIINP